MFVIESSSWKEFIKYLETYLHFKAKKLKPPVKKYPKSHSYLKPELCIEFTTSELKKSLPKFFLDASLQKFHDKTRS